MSRAFAQVDVFTTEPYRGNPVAVVLDGSGLTTEEMQRFASWTNLSETTFVLPPEADGADYRVRIFTPSRELPFAGHPTLGTCHAWLEHGGLPAGEGAFVQECPAGLIQLRRHDGILAFAAPPLIRSGPVEDDVMERVAAQLGIDRSAVVDAAWADNGPGWVAVMLRTPEEVLAVAPGPVDLDIGLVAAYPEGSELAYEVRAFFPAAGGAAEDPVTGSLNAGLAQWLIGSGQATPPYVAAQGVALGRAGRVHVDRDAEGEIWIGGGTVTCVSGSVEL